jgi:hypothetical protein
MGLLPYLVGIILVLQPTALTKLHDATQEPKSVSLLKVHTLNPSGERRTWLLNHTYKNNATTVCAFAGSA